MPYDPEKHHRRSIRWAEWDYAEDGVYFVTVCVKGRNCLFGEIVDGEMAPNEAGRVVQAVWEEAPRRFPGFELDSFVVMPNHFHGIIGCVEAGIALSLQMDAAKSAPGLGGVVGAFKSVSALRVNRLLKRSGPLWQRNYYEYIIRDENSLDRIRVYIADNPFHWDRDRENPKRAPQATPLRGDPWRV